MFTMKASEIWRQYQLDGVPTSGAYKPKKPEIRPWAKVVEDFIEAFSTVDHDLITLTGTAAANGYTADGVIVREVSGNTQVHRLFHEERKVSLLWYDPKRDGTSDSKTAVTAWATAVQAKAVEHGFCYGYVPNIGVPILTSETILVGSNTTLGGGGWLKIHDAMPLTFAGTLAQNQRNLISTASRAGVISQQNIKIENLTLDGNSPNRPMTVVRTPVGINGTITTDERSNLVLIASVNGFELTNCHVFNHHHALVALQGVINFKIDNNHLHDWGLVQNLPDHPADGGSAIVALSNGATRSKHGSMSHNKIHDGMWSGIQPNSDYTIVAKNEIWNTKESGIFARSIDGTADDNVGVQIEGNIIDGITKNYVDAAGIVCNAKQAKCIGNHITRCDAAGISAGHNSSDTIIANNTIIDCVQDAAGFPGSAGILVRDASDTEQLATTTIIGNRVKGLMPRGIAVFLVGTTIKVDNIVIQNNDVVEAAALPANNIFIGPGIVGSGWVIDGNRGGKNWRSKMFWHDKMLTTSNAPATIVETAVGITVQAGVEFVDGATKIATVFWKIPDSWDGGNVRARFWWTSANQAEAGDVLWQAQIAGIDDGSTSNVLFSGGAVVTDTGTGEDKMQKSAVSGEFAITGNANPGAMAMVRIARFGAAGGDTAIAAVMLQGVELIYGDNGAPQYIQ